MINILVIILTVAVFGKWIIFILFAPSQAAYSYYKKGYTFLLWKILAIPFVLLNRVTRGGYLLFMLYRVGLTSSNHIRKLFYRIAGAKLASKVTLHIGLQARMPWKLSIGKGSIIGDHCILDARSGLVIGEDVNISSNVSIWTLQHDYRNPDFACPTPDQRRLDVKIENRVWLGCNVIVLPGVTIGEGAVCCGGCVVTKDVEPYSVVAGIPAKKIGERPRNLRYEFSGKTCMMF